MLTLLRTYEVEAAHLLTAGVPDGHPCRRLHGHRYVITIGVAGVPGQNGMLIEYAELDRFVCPILAVLDHHLLNSLRERCTTGAAVDVSENPTVERLCAWLRIRLLDLRPHAVLIRVQEDSRSVVEWSRDGGV